MIPDFRWRDGNEVEASFWHGEAMVCPEYFATEYLATWRDSWRDSWRDRGNIPISAGDTASAGNHAPLLHGFSSLAVALTVLLLIDTQTAHASRHCLDRAEAARTWPTQVLARDDDGCWTYDHHSRRAGVTVAVRETPASMQAATLPNRWDDRESDSDTVQLELASFEPERVSEPPLPGTLASASQFALLISLVLAIAAVVEVATGRHASRSRWPDRKTLAEFKRR
jgi:hypothetical protein